MFDFLFKRPPSHLPPTQSQGSRQRTAPPASQQPKEHTEPQGAQAEAARLAAAEAKEAKLAAQAQADALDDEAAAVEFILSCAFADARLKAAALVHSRAMLERVHHATRDSDRRVAKLMQGRLDAILRLDAQRQKARDCIERTRRLLEDPQLKPNLVSDLDRAWQVIGLVSDTPEVPEAAIFLPLRAELGQRLQDQTALQRNVMDALAALRQLVAAAEAMSTDGSALPQAGIPPAMAAATVASTPPAPSEATPANPEADPAAAPVAAQETAQVTAQETAQEAAPMAAPVAAQAAAPVAAQAAAPVAAPAATPMAAAPVGALAGTLAGLDARIAACAASPELPSLPRHLLAEYNQERAAFGPVLAALERGHQAIQARTEALAGWEGAHVASLNQDQLRRAWEALPPLPESALRVGSGGSGGSDGSAAQGGLGKLGAALQARFDALLGQCARLRAPKEDAKAAVQAAARLDGRKQFSSVLEAMESALQQGLLQSAAEHDKALREIKGVRLSDTQNARVAHARSELGRLQGWAKWGGNVSREELIKAVDELQRQQLPVAELAKKVGSSRERWKSLDVVSGPAPKSLWERFDAACTTAYAPAALHFKRLADERLANLLKAKGLLAEAKNLVATTFGASPAAKTAEANPEAGPDAQPQPGAAANRPAPATASDADWKRLAAACLNAKQVWSRLGPIDRKDKKKLDAEFDAAMQALQEPLEQQRREGIRRREKLIAEAQALNPKERGALDSLRALQERWQEQAKALPLERGDEQALWLRFRAACDALFEQRKESASQADAERRGNLAAKQALCAGLEAALEQTDSTPAANTRLLREVEIAWDAVGHVPRASEPQLLRRYQAALDALHKRIEAGKRAAGMAQTNALRDKLHLCQALEAALASALASAAGAADPDAVAAWNGRWQALPPLAAEYEKALGQRFQAGLAALAGGDPKHLSALEQNRAALLLELLRLEIVLGLESPAEHARDRLRLQVEVLQSSLKSGQKPASHGAQMLRLCSLPSLVDAAGVKRIDRLLRTYAI